MNLHQLDLNLLLLFDALYRYRSVSIAANEIYLSQSAFSHGLSRLRKRLSDELFIRINNVMEPTPFAHELAIHITPALAQLHNGLNNSLAFDPTTSDIELAFSATDYTQFSLLPKLIGHISKVAPNIKITVTPSEDKVQTAKLVSGELDFVLGFSHEVESQSNSLTSTILVGLVIGLANPKAILFYMGFFPAFVELSNIGAHEVMIILLTSTFAVGGVLSAYALAGAKARHVFKGDKARTRMNRLSSTILASCGVLLAIKG